MKKRTILFIQGGGKGAYKEDKKLAISLLDSLGEEFIVQFPKMPNEDNPDYNTYKNKIVQELEKIKDRLLLVGHSIGSCFLLKYFSETEINNNVSGLFLIATPFWGEGGWQYEGFSINNTLASKSTENIPVFFYHGTNDEIVPFTHLSLYTEKFPHAVIRKITGQGHQLNNDLSAVARDIKSLDVSEDESSRQIQNRKI